MNVKIFSVNADSDFRAIRIGDETRMISANDYLERIIQEFLDQHPKAEIKHVQLTSTAIIPKNASWNTTNTHIEWEIEKSIIIFFQE